MQPINQDNKLCAVPVVVQPGPELVCEQPQLLRVDLLVCSCLLWPELFFVGQCGVHSQAEGRDERGFLPPGTTQTCLPCSIKVLKKALMCMLICTFLLFA